MRDEKAREYEENVELSRYELSKTWEEKVMFYEHEWAGLYGLEQSILKIGSPESESDELHALVSARVTAPKG